MQLNLNLVRVVMLSASLTFGASFAFAAPRVSPAVNKVVALYKEYAWTAMFYSPNLDLMPLESEPLGKLNTIFVPELAHALHEDRTKAVKEGTTGQVDFILLFFCQDCSVRDVSIQQGRTPTEVSVCFENPAANEVCLTVTTRLVKGSVRVHDIVYPQMSLRKLLGLSS